MAGKLGERNATAMKVLRRTVMATVILLACAGVYSALRNLPISSGCSFYGECPDDAAKTDASDAASSESIAP